MTNLPFGLESKGSYAALSPTDLQSMGKRASMEYLAGVSPLNDAIVKLAREYPSISAHQVRRVVEFANQETFARLFADNEKYAQDKNIEFDIADPADVLLDLNNGARPNIVSSYASEYDSAPVKLGHSALEADVELARVFGVELELPGMSKTANANQDIFSPLSRILSVGSVGKYKHADMTGGMAPQQVPQMPQQAPQQPQEDDGLSHNQQMLALQREIELSKKRQELQKVQQQTLDAMNPQGQPGAVPAPGPAMPGPAPDAGAAAAPQQDMPPGQEGAPPPDMQGQPQAAVPPPAEGAIMAPPGGEPMKTSALLKEAMAHIKCDRPGSSLLKKAMSSSVSVERIKQATAGRGAYPESNPWGDVLRSRGTLEAALHDANYACSKNRELYKEARARLQKVAAQHLWEGGNLGEIAHVMASVADNPGVVKVALEAIVPELQRQGLDINKARAAAIQYEMTKGASVRKPNPDNSIVDAFAAMCKIAHAQTQLEEARAQLVSQYTMVDRAVKEAMLHAATR